MSGLTALILVGGATSPLWVPSGGRAAGGKAGAETGAGAGAPNPLAPGGVLHLGGTPSTAASAPVLQDRNTSEMPAATPTDAPHYDANVTLTCDLGTPVRRGNTLVIRPHVTVAGHADPNRVFTVADLVVGDAVTKKTGTYVGEGLGAEGVGAEVDVPIPGDFGFPADQIYVGIAYFAPGAPLPAAPDGFSNTGDRTNRTAEVACGNAALNWALANGGVQLPANG